jgi:hypothetical protein
MYLDPIYEDQKNIKSDEIEQLGILGEQFCFEQSSPPVENLSTPIFHMASKTRTAGS